MDLLKAENISKSFGGLKAIKNVTFEVKDSEILALIGPNGAGKTTLLNLITNFTTPDEGHVFFKDKSIDKLPRHKIVKLGIARTFQALTVFENLTVTENLKIGQSTKVNTNFWRNLNPLSNNKNKDRNKSSTDTAITGVLNFVEFDTKFLKHKVGELSTLDKKRIAIACALASDPKLLLLDEPLAGLNQIEAEQLTNLFTKIKDKGTSILLIDHNLEAVMSIACRVCVLNFGEIMCSGSPTEIVNNKRVCEVYLGE